MEPVSLTVDWGNGSQKSFEVPWRDQLTILEAIQAATSIPPGLAVEFGSTRTGAALDLSLDGVPHTGEFGKWSITVNDKTAPTYLGTATSFHFLPDSRAENEVKPGDHILAKFADAQ